MNLSRTALATLALASAIAGLATKDVAAAETRAATPLFNIEEAAITGGRLVIRGTAARPRLPIQIAGTRLRTVSSASGAFAFSADIQPATCKVTLRSSRGQLGVLIAGCGVAGDKGKAGAEGPVGPEGKTGATGPAMILIVIFSL